MLLCPAHIILAEARRFQALVSVSRKGQSGRTQSFIRWLVRKGHEALVVQPRKIFADRHQLLQLWHRKIPRRFRQVQGIRRKIWCGDI